MANLFGVAENSAPDGVWKFPKFPKVLNPNVCGCGWGVRRKARENVELNNVLHCSIFDATRQMKSVAPRAFFRRFVVGVLINRKEARHGSSFSHPSRINSGSILLGLAADWQFGAWVEKHFGGNETDYKILAKFISKSATKR